MLEIRVGTELLGNSPGRGIVAHNVWPVVSEVRASRRPWRRSARGHRRSRPNVWSLAEPTLRCKVVVGGPRCPLYRVSSTSALRRCSTASSGRRNERYLGSMRVGVDPANSGRVARLQARV